MSSDEFRSHAQSILERLDAEPDRIVCTDAEQSCTAQHFAALVRGFARALRVQGVARGGRVALVAPNTVAALAVRYGATLNGTITGYCPGIDAPHRLAAFLDRIDPDVVVVFPQTQDVMCRVPTSARVLTVGTDLCPELDEADRSFGISVGAEELGTFVASGGTTGASKASLRTFAAQLRMVDGGLDPDRRQLVCTPLAYVAQVGVDQTLLGGGAVVLHETFDPGAVLETIERERITHLGLVEPLLVELVDCPARGRHDLSSLRSLTHIGADAPPELRYRLLSALGPDVLVHVYGASEFGLAAVSSGTDYSLTRPDLLGTAGRPLPDIEVRILDSDGGECAPGEVGLIAVRSAAAAIGYTEKTDDASGFAADGWFRTSDLGTLDDAGYLHVRGRARDRRTIGGITVLPVDIENALCGHPFVRYCVAAPLDSHPDGFEAWVVGKPGAHTTSQELERHLRAVGGAHFTDVRVTIVDRIPVTEQGKPDRRALTAAGVGR